MQSRKSVLTFLWLLLALFAGVAAAQQQETTSASAPQPERKITKQEADVLFRSVDEILQFASKDTGLPIKHTVKRKLASRDEVSKYIADRMKDDEDSKRLQRSEVVLKKFGLIPQEFDLRTFLADLLKEQVAGFYDTKKKTVFLLDWVEPESQKPVLAHELTHALQDQNFNLEKWMKQAEKPASKKNGRRDLASDLMQDERLAARQAVSEGQAMVVLVDYMLAPDGYSVKNNPQFAAAVMAGMAESGETPLYTKAPMFLKQLLLFPYQRGLKFEADVLQKAGTQSAFAGVFQNPPGDSRQILQPETYVNKQVVEPMAVPDFEGAAGKGYARYDLSVMGEFDVWLLAKQYSGQESADTLSPAWRGGYYYAAVKPDDGKAKDNEPQIPTSSVALAYASKWATVDAAQQFAAVYAKYLPKRYKSVTEIAGKPPSGSDSNTHAWETNEGSVSIEVRGDTMLVMEGFEQRAADRIRSAVFQPQTHSLAH